MKPSLDRNPMTESHRPSKYEDMKVLLISYHFPPSQAVGGLRIANFAKYLPSFGWIPYVLTLGDQALEHQDRERLKGLEEIKIIKAAPFLTLAGLYAGVKRLGFGFFEKRVASKNSAGDSTHQRPHQQYQEPLIHKWKRYLLSFLLLPDAERGWIIPAFFKAVREIKTKRIQCVLTSCPPWSVHIIGLLIKKTTGVKWVADFRDPWTTTSAKRLYPTCTLSIKIESWLERKTIEIADLILFNVQAARDIYQKKYLKEPPDKFVYIPNGIDHKIFARLRPGPKYEKFTLSYTGSLYIGRSPEPVFKAISELIRERTVSPSNILVKLAGQCRFVDGRPITEMIQAYGLEDMVEVQDIIPYGDALQIVRRSHLALLFAPNLPYQIPAKVYDYIGAGARILAIAEPGATADLIHSTRTGRAYPSWDIQGIKDFLHQALANGHPGDQNREKVLSRFNAKRVTETLVHGLNKIVDNNQDERPCEASRPS